jgi:hypothetical protein
VLTILRWELFLHNCGQKLCLCCPCSFHACFAQPGLVADFLQHM